MENATYVQKKGILYLGKSFKNLFFAKIFAP